jgi:DNA repair protein RadC
MREQSIRYWSEDDRPREKLLNNGKLALSNAELIAILLGSGNRDESAVDLAQRILNEANNNLIELSKFDISALKKFKGIGDAKAISIAAALELGKRRREAETIKKNKVTSSKDVFEVMQSVLADLQYEQFWVLLLSRSNKILKKINISDGGVSGTVADPKRIFKIAIENLASGIILCHNHPSGNISPSVEDKNITKKIKYGVKYFDIQLLDHIIIGDENYFSFTDEGILAEL